MYFETERLLAREITIDDFDSFCEMQGNPNVMRYITGKPKTTEENKEEFDKILASYKNQDSEFLVMAIEKIDNNEFIGTCAVIKDEIGYRLLENHWGNGFGKEILEGLIKFCLITKGLNQIYACVDSNNTASVKLLDNSRLRLIEECINQETGSLERLYELNKSDIRVLDYHA